MTAKPRHHGIGLENEGLVNLIEGQMAAFDAVFSGKDLAEEVAGFFGQPAPFWPARNATFSREENSTFPTRSWPNWIM
ncbi:MAG: hypothetical protein EB079_07945 [Verrucomicrobia bacterium]|nr:hypothetical protein [Verrucomicrobiota bacterium]